MRAFPEPAIWAMLLLGFAGVGFMAYRRQTTIAEIALVSIAVEEPVLFVRPKMATSAWG